jgi:hypothetical protein
MTASSGLPRIVSSTEDMDGESTAADDATIADMSAAKCRWESV